MKNQNHCCCIKRTFCSLFLVHFAADSIDAAQAQNREAIGTVSVSGVASSPMDIREMLNKKRKRKAQRPTRLLEARSGDTGTLRLNCTK